MRKILNALLVENLLLATLAPWALGGDLARPPLASPEAVRGIRNLISLDAIGGFGLQNGIGTALGPALDPGSESDRALVKTLLDGLAPNFEQVMEGQSLMRPEYDPVFQDATDNRRFIAAVTERGRIEALGKALAGAYEATKGQLAPEYDARRQLLAAAQSGEVFDGGNKGPGAGPAAKAAPPRDNPPLLLPAKARVLLRSGGPRSASERQTFERWFGQSGRIGLLTAAGSYKEDFYFKDMKSQVLSSLFPDLFRQSEGWPPFRAPALPQQAPKLVHLRWDDRALETLGQVDALIVGGGWTQLLLSRLRASGLLGAIKDRVLAGMPYEGSSAGAIVAGPNILTNKDSALPGLRNFDALGLVPFNITPHYEPVRDAMLRGYHAIRSNRVFAIEDGAAISVEAGQAVAHGDWYSWVRTFQRGQSPVWHRPGDKLTP